MHHCHWFCLLYTRDHKNSNKVKALSYESGYEVLHPLLQDGTPYEGHKLAGILAGICCQRLPRWRIDRLPIVLCCLSLLRFIEMTKKNQQRVGPLKWESEGDVVRFYYRCSQLKIARFRVTISVKAA